MRIELKQRSPEWLEWRRRGGDGNPYVAALGGSDAPVVMGVSPYKTRERLRLEKLFGCDLTNVNEYYANMGYEWETAAPVQLGLDITKGGPACFVSDERPWQIASVDWEENGRLYEFKWTSKEIDDSFKIPDHWYAQAQHIMDVVGAKKITFAICGKNNVIVVKTVELDGEYVARLRMEEEEFLAGLSRSDALAIPDDIDIAQLNEVIIAHIEAGVPNEITSVEQAERARTVAEIAQKLLKRIEEARKVENEQVQKKYKPLIERLSAVKERFYEAVSAFAIRDDFKVRVPGVSFYEVIEFDVYDKDMVPREFMEVDMRAVRLLVSKKDLPKTSEWVDILPGIRVRAVPKVKLS